jgi:hypothetical protein
VNKETNNSTGNNEEMIQNKNHEETRHHSDRSKIKEQLVIVWYKARPVHMSERKRLPTMTKSYKLICQERHKLNDRGNF